MKRAVYLSAGMAILLLGFTSCEKQEEFRYNLDYLTGTQWGLPQIQYEGQLSHEFDTNFPVVFYKEGENNGRVDFGGVTTDFWEVRDSQSLLIQERAQIWQVLKLTENQLQVDILKYPSGEQIVTTIYYSIE